jgi:hypothetical protein
MPNLLLRIFTYLMSWRGICLMGRRDGNLHQAGLTLSSRMSTIDIVDSRRLLHLQNWP